MIVNTSSAVVEDVGVAGGGLAVFNPPENADLDQADWANQSDQTDLQEPLAEQIEEVIKQEKSFDEKKFWHEIELLARLKELRIGRDDIEAELVDARGDAKSLKDSLKEANELVGDLESQLKDNTDAILDTVSELRTMSNGAIDQIPAKPIEDRKGDSLVGNVEIEGWRSHATSDLLKGMKGNKGKRDAVVELAPTVGHLWDLRAGASIDHKDFNEVLPKGCGKGFAQTVDELMSMFITRWELQKANPQSAKQSDELVAEVRESAKQNDWQREDCQPKETDSAAMRAGFTAFGEGRPYSDAVLDDLHAAKQWMTGWVSGEVLKSLVE